jgi:hypothetical protein
VAKKRANNSGSNAENSLVSSNSSLISPAPLSTSIGFVPIISKEDLENDNLNNFNSSYVEPPLAVNVAEYGTPQKKRETSDQNINEISAINNTTVQSSINTS